MLSWSGRQPHFPAPRPAALPAAEAGVAWGGDSFRGQRKAGARLGPTSSWELCPCRQLWDPPQAGVCPRQLWGNVGLSPGWLSDLRAGVSMSMWTLDSKTRGRKIMEEGPNFRRNKIIVKTEHHDKPLPTKEKEKICQKSGFTKKSFSWKSRGEAGDSTATQSTDVGCAVDIY